MTVLTDKQILARCIYQAPNEEWVPIATPMIEPFIPANVNKIDTTFITEGTGLPVTLPQRMISFGLSSFGYDARLAPTYKLFTPVIGGPSPTIVDPKNVDDRCFVDYEGDSVIMPPHSFMLGHTVEYFRIPDDVVVICLGKSTYARCFTGDTKVALVDGRAMTLKRMAKLAAKGERFWGYTIKSDGSVGVEELINPRKTASQQSLVAVELDNGEVVRCTPDHKFMLRNGQYRRADRLRAGDSLMPLYRYDVRGYEVTYDPLKQKLGATHRLSDKWNLENGVYYKRNVPEHRHHADHNRRNNNPTNIVRLPASDHIRLHNQRFFDPGYLSFHSSTIREALAEKLKDRKFKNAWVRRAKEASEDFWNSDKYAKARKRWHKAQIASWGNADSNRRRLASDRLKLRAKEMRSFSSGRLRKDLTDNVVRQAILDTGTITAAADKLHCSRRLIFRRFRHVIDVLQRQRKLAVNHKVVGVTKLAEKEDVYCLTVPNTQNFALESGVFVHNCGLIVNVTPLEPGWEGQVTIEISNTTPLPARVYGNEGIAQFLFFQGTERPAVTYGDRKGKYQGQRGVTPARI